MSRKYLVHIAFFKSCALSYAFLILSLKNQLFRSCAGWASGDSFTDKGQQTDSTSLVFEACRDDRWSNSNVTSKIMNDEFVKVWILVSLFWTCNPVTSNILGIFWMDVERWDAMLISRRIPSGCNRSFQRLSIVHRILLCWNYSLQESCVTMCSTRVHMWKFFGEVFEAMKKLTFTSELFCPQKAVFWCRNSMRHDETRMSGKGKKRKMREIEGF